jgi:5,10-methylenetetrahydromethanopterin reductase
MKYGLLLLGEHPPDRLTQLAQLAEAHGFQDVWLADEKFFRDPFVSLSHVAQHTRSIRVGTCVTDPFTRHPALIALAAATLDEVCGGRFVLGLGAGFSGLESMGVQRVKTVRSLRHAMEAIRRLWAGESVTMEDDAFVLHHANLDFAARPTIPILLATAGRQVLRLAGEAADEVMLGDLGSREVVTSAWAEVERGAARVGRNLTGVRRIARLNVVLSEDLETAREAIRPWILAYLWHAYPDWSHILDYTPDWEERMQPLRDFIAEHGGKPRNVDDRNQVLRFAPLLPESLVRRYALAGRVPEVVEQIRELDACGIDQIALYPTALPGQSLESMLRQFLERVVPET